MRRISTWLGRARDGRAGLQHSSQKSPGCGPVAIESALVHVHHRTDKGLCLSDLRARALHELPRALCCASRPSARDNNLHPPEDGAVGNGAPEPPREPQDALNDEVREVVREPVEGDVAREREGCAIIPTHPRRGHPLGAPRHNDFHGQPQPFAARSAWRRTERVP